MYFHSINFLPFADYYSELVTRVSGLVSAVV